MAKDDDDKPEAKDDDHSLDMSQAAVKRMIADARERGYITYDQLNYRGLKVIIALRSGKIKSIVLLGIVSTYLLKAREGPVLRGSIWRMSSYHVSECKFRTRS